jgi:HAMP domain-containing protein
MSLRDLLILSGLWAMAGGVFLLVIELRLRHHLGRLGSIGESLDGVALALRTKVEGLDTKLVETRQEQVRQAEAIGGLRESVDLLMDSHKSRHGIGGRHG